MASLLMASLHPPPSGQPNTTGFPFLLLQFANSCLHSEAQGSITLLYVDVASTTARAGYHALTLMSLKVLERQWP